MARGTVLLMIGSVVFMTSNYAIHFGLARHLGPEEYGLFGVILALMGAVNMLSTSGFPRAASKYIAADIASLSSIVVDSIRLGVLLSLFASALYVGLASVLASLLNDSGLTVYIRFSAIAIPFYALYALYGNGYLNGRRQFGSQAKATIISSLARVGMVSTLVLLGLGVKGAILGYVFGAAIGLILTWRLLGPLGEKWGNCGWGRLLAFGVPATLFAVALFLIMSVDLMAVKAIAKDDLDAGLYTSATTIARVPYFVFGGLASTVLPSVSRSIAANDLKLTANYVTRSLRYMLMALVPGMLIVSATSHDVISLVYSSAYVEATSPLRVLVFGLSFLSVFVVLAHVIMAEGKPSVALGIALPVLAVDIGLNILLVPTYGLTGAAWSTTLASLCAMCAASLYVLRRFNALPSMKSILKIFVASLVVYAIALHISLPPSFLPLAYVGLFGVYLGLLLLMGEFTKKDVETLKRIVVLPGLDGDGERRRAYFRGLRNRRRGG